MRKGRISNLDDSDKKDDDLSEGLEIVNLYKEKINEIRKERNHQKYIEKNKKGKKGKKAKYVSIGIIISIILILVFLFFYFGPLIGISINRNVGINEENKIDIASTDSDIFDTYCSDILIYNNQKLMTYNNRGVKNWEYDLDLQFTPKIYVKGRYLMITNNSNGKIYFFENKKEILNTKIDGQINQVFLDENGNYVVEYSTSGYKKVLGVYTKNGKNLYNAYLSSNPILDIAILENASKLLVLQTNTSSFKVGININIVDSKNESQIKTIATLDNNFVYNLTIQGQNIIMLLDDKIVKCNIDTSDINDIFTFDTNQLMYISLYNNYYTMISKKLNKENSDSNYAITSNRFDNTTISSLNINDSPKLMKNSSILNYLVYQDKLQIINKWGIEVKNIDIKFPPKDIVIFNNGKSVGLIYTNNIYIVNI